MRELNAAGLDLIKSFESLRLAAYDDTTGKTITAGVAARGRLTIGWGHTTGVQSGQTCTQAQAEAWLAGDLAPAIATVDAAVTAPLTDNQFAALVSFVFNVGIAAFKDSTLLQRLNAGHYDVVPQQLARWNKVRGRVAAGLTRRRAAEATLWSTAVAGATVTSMPDAPTHWGHLVTLGGITVGAVSTMLSDFAQQLQPLAGYGGLIKNAFLIVSVAAAIIAVAARTHSFHKNGV